MRNTPITYKPHCDFNDFAKRYEAGESSKTIAASYGVTPITVLRHLRRLGVDIRKPGSMGAPRKLGGKEREVLALYSEGVPARTIAKNLGVNEATVTSELHRHGAVIRIGRPSRILIQPEFEAIVDLYRENHSSMELASRFGVSHTRILKILKDRGVTRRKPGRVLGKVDGLR